MSDTLANFAASMFRARRTRRLRAVEAGEQTPEQAEQVLRPWLAIAIDVGADLHEFADLLAETVIYERNMDAAARERRQRDTRRRVADDIAPLSARRDLVERERNHALNVLGHAMASAQPPATLENLRHTAAMLVALADHVGVTAPYLPKVPA